MKKLAILAVFAALAALTLSGTGCLLRVQGPYDDGVSHHHRGDQRSGGRTPQSPPRPRGH